MKIITVGKHHVQKTNVSDLHGLQISDKNNEACESVIVFHSLALAHTALML
jgi:hypothetical protein